MSGAGPERPSERGLGEPGGGQSRLAAMAQQELARLTRQADEEQARLTAARGELARLEDEAARLRVTIGQVRDAIARGRRHVAELEEWFQSLAELLPALPSPATEGRGETRGLGRLYSRDDEPR